MLNKCKKKLLTISAIACLINIAIAQTTPALPNTCLLSTEMADTAGYIVKTVGPSGMDYTDLQQAINNSALGTILKLEAGVVFTGNYTLPIKTGTGWVILISSRMDLLPVIGVRVNPNGITGNGNYPTQKDAMPKIVSPNSAPAIATDLKAHHYRFVGIEISIDPAAPLSYGVLALGDAGSAQNTLDKVAHHITIDRCFIHGHSTGDLSRGIALNSASTVIIDSYISECHGVGFDSQAIAGWNGPGPFKIINNYLEGAGENILFGGADPSIPNMVPSDIELRNNYLFKPLSWMQGHPSYAGIHWSIKNIFELKNAQRVIVDGNIMENNWSDGQTGVAVLFTVRNQDGTAPWSVVQDVTFTNNIVKHSGGAVNILGIDDNYTSQQTSRVRIANNLFDDINDATWGGNGTFLIITESMDIQVDHNTVIQTGNIITAYGAPNVNFIFTNNITNHNAYGIVGDNLGTGNGAIGNYFPDITDANKHLHKNVFIGGSLAYYSNYTTISDNEVVATDANVGFVNFANGGSDYHNYALSPSSVYKNDGTDGKDLGVDFVKMDSAFSFIVNDAIVLQSPPNGSVNQPLIPVLTWKTEYCADQYIWQLDSVNTFNSGAFQTGTFGATTNVSINVSPSLLAVGETYFWRVRGANAIDTVWSDIWMFTSDMSIGIVNDGKENGFSIYPNPMRENAVIKLQSLVDLKNATLTISDIHGRILKMVTGLPEPIIIYRDGLANGIYLVQLRTENGYVHVSKMIVN